MESLHDRVIVLDRDLRHVEIYGNSRLERDNDPERWLGKTAAEISGPAAAAIHESMGRRALAGETVIYEWSWEDATEGRLWYQTRLSPIHATDGTVTGIVSVSHEVTSIRRALDSTTAGEARFRTLVNSMDGMVTVFDPELRVTGVFGDWTDRARREGDGPLADLVPAVLGAMGEPAFGEAAGRALAGEHVTHDWSMSRAGGRRHLRSVLSPIRDREGALRGVVAITRDISRQREAEDAVSRLEQARQHGQQLESLGRLAGGVAHDFNNLLTVINGYADLLRSSPALEPAARKMAEEIGRAGERAATLTRQLLAVGRRQTLQPRVLNLNALVLDMVDMLARVLGEPVELVSHLSPALGLVRADPGQVQQVLMNLAVNARDAMPDGGILTIETAHVQFTEEDARWHHGVRPGTYVLLQVSDTGSGMTSEVMTRLFEPFFTTKGPGRGTGLGLSIVQGIVKQSGGDVMVYSEPAKGTVVKVYLPLAPGTEVVEASDPVPASGERGTETILLVEDEARIRELVGGYLERLGYRVLTAADGILGATLVETHGQVVDLVVTDVVMPNLSGPEMVARLRAGGRRVRVIYVSGYTASHAATLGPLNGPDTDFLQKPFPPAELARRIRALLARA